MSCVKDCLHCPYPDCLNDDYGPEDLDAVIEAEKCAGIYTEHDEKCFQDELFYALSASRSKASLRVAVAERKFRERTKAVILKIQNNVED